MKVSLKSKLEDASREQNKINIKIRDFFHGAASPAATQEQPDAVNRFITEFIEGKNAVLNLLVLTGSFRQSKRN